MKIKFQRDYPYCQPVWKSGDIAEASVSHETFGHTIYRVEAPNGQIWNPVGKLREDDHWDCVEYR